jgi:hypothetical protein
MSADIHDRLRRLEEAVGKLRGVRGARADLDATGAPLVRVLVVPESDPAAIQGAISRLARSAGVTLAPTSVEVLRADLPGARRSRRRRLSSLSISRNDDGFTARVGLALDGDVLLGEVHGPTGRSFEMRAIARAVLEGLGGLLDRPTQLDSVHLLQVGDTRLAVVQVTTDEDMLVGSALVRLDEHDAVARATLAAINRLAWVDPEGANSRMAGVSVR